MIVKLEQKENSTMKSLYVKPEALVVAIHHGDAIMQETSWTVQDQNGNSQGGGQIITPGDGQLPPGVELAKPVDVWTGWDD